MTQISIEELQDNFTHFDTDSDGTIELSEFNRLLVALDALAPGESDPIGFDAIDTDGNGRIDFKEFSDWFNNRN
ncbi:EF-hand domain-containing protein [Shewanella woodyi]|uniref:Putative signal transduction protein with EFhand domain n=1 Tax=Shewanella woodyi (strain ATCC 51908 / MS32) TaxID=392500 RepID=B1KFA7_SHEWM|nr:EF-hand domain-containing protein [Shewanella woodyi]ACA86648.1 putative signal transduction protein with EFhand domain [Shewanella woodyi ATCC 51908]